MRTVHPSIVIGSYGWDQDRVPRDEFQIRTQALDAVMDANGWKAILIYGDAAEHSALAYFSNFTPRLRWSMALLPRAGEPRLLVSMSPRDLPAMRLMTWIADVQSGWNWPSAFDPWLAKLDAEGPSDIGTVGFDMMRPTLFRSLQTSLGNRFRLHEADATVGACRTPRPRTLSLTRGAVTVMSTAADAFVKAWRDGDGAEKAALAGERTARFLAAQDVRTLASSDGGRTFAPFSGRFAAKGDRLAGYIAVKHMGYWADTFMSSTRHGSDVDRRVQASLDGMLHAIGPGIAAAALHAKAIEGLGSHSLHAVLSGSIGARIGLSLDEGGRLTADASHVLAPGEVYSLHVGAYDPACGGGFASAMVAATASGHELLYRSPSRADA